MAQARDRPAPAICAEVDLGWYQNSNQPSRSASSISIDGVSDERLDRYKASFKDTFYRATCLSIGFELRRCGPTAPGHALGKLIEAIEPPCARRSAPRATS
jgi:hypothetical protein